MMFKHRKTTTVGDILRKKLMIGLFDDERSRLIGVGDYNKSVLMGIAAEIDEEVGLYYMLLPIGSDGMPVRPGDVMDGRMVEAVDEKAFVFEEKDGRYEKVYAYGYRHGDPFGENDG